MEWIAKSVRVYVRVLTGIVDLNFVTLVYCDLPVICRIGIAESRETDEYARVVVRERCPPVDTQNKIRELRLFVPKQSDPIERFDDVGTEFDESTEARHLPTGKSAVSEWNEAVLDWKV